MKNLKITALIFALASTIIAHPNEPDFKFTYKLNPNIEFNPMVEVTLSQNAQSFMQKISHAYFTAITALGLYSGVRLGTHLAKAMKNPNDSTSRTVVKNAAAVLAPQAVCLPLYFLSLKKDDFGTKTYLALSLAAAAGSLAGYHLSDTKE